MSFKVQGLCNSSFSWSFSFFFPRFCACLFKKKYDTIISHMPNSKCTLDGLHRNINDHFAQVCALFFSKLVIRATQVFTNV